MRVTGELFSQETLPKADSGKEDKALSQGNHGGVGKGMSWNPKKI